VLYLVSRCVTCSVHLIQPIHLLRWRRVLAVLQVLTQHFRRRSEVVRMARVDDVERCIRIIKEAHMALFCLVLGL